MTLREGLALVGYALQAAGILIAAIGLRSTWRQFAPATEHFLGPIEPLGRAVRGGLWRFPRVVSFGRLRPPTQRIALEGIGSLELVGRLQVKHIYGELPSDPAAAIAVLDQRVRGLNDTVTTLADRVTDETTELRTDLGALDARLTSETVRLEATARTVATEGIRLETLGLVVVAIGLGFQVAAGVAG